MILNKFRIQHDWIDRPEFTRFFTPFCHNMLNALENNGERDHRNGKLTEHSPTFWEWEYEKGGRRGRIYVTMLDETEEFGNSAKPTGRVIAPPKFK